MGSVHAIKRGLTVQPPHHPAGRGKVRQSLYSQYGLHTKRQQKASLAFRDGTLLHMNQLTNLVLRSPSVTYVSSGEVDQLSVPGSNHQVQTASAVASAIGTQFDSRVRGNRTTIVVVEGAVLVKNAKGSVVVKTNQQTTVVKGKPPRPPTPVDAASKVSWTNALPPPDQPLGENAALDANGGAVVAYSSQRSSADGRWDARNVDDGRLDRGWATAQGQTTNQWVIIGFGGNGTHAISSLLIDPAATGGLALDTDLGPSPSASRPPGPMMRASRQFSPGPSSRAPPCSASICLTRSMLVMSSWLKTATLAVPTASRWLSWSSSPWTRLTLPRPRPCRLPQPRLRPCPLRRPEPHPHQQPPAHQLLSRRSMLPTALRNSVRAWRPASMRPRQFAAPTR